MGYGGGVGVAQNIGGGAEMVRCTRCGNNIVTALGAQAANCLVCGNVEAVILNPGFGAPAFGAPGFGGGVGVAQNIGGGAEMVRCTRCGNNIVTQLGAPIANCMACGNVEQVVLNNGGMYGAPGFY